MESIQDYIEQLEWKIGSDRYRARKLRRRGWILPWPVALAILALGALAAFAVLLESAKSDPMIGGPKMSHLESSIVDPHPIIWGLLYWIGPPSVPGNPQGGHMGFFIWLCGGMLLFAGLIWLGESAVKKAGKLEARAEKYDDILTAQRPTWVTLDEINKKGGPSGGAGPIIQQIIKMVNQPDVDKRWYVLPAGVVTLGVISTVLAAAITKLLGLT